MGHFLTQPPASPDGQPLIVPVGVEKFTRPEPLEVSRGQAMLSALSLLVLTVASVLAIVSSGGWPWWAVLPFVFTAVGGGVGFAYESLLILRGRPFRLGGSAVGIFIQAMRRGNMGFVFGSVYLLYYLLGYGAAGGAEWPIVLIAAGAGYLFIMNAFVGPPLPMAFVLTIGLGAQLLWVWTSPDLAGRVAGRALLSLAALGLYGTVVVGVLGMRPPPVRGYLSPADRYGTPAASTAFHLVASAVVALLYLGTALAFSGDAGPGARAVQAPGWFPTLAAVGAGIWLAFRLYPNTWANFRSPLANFIWPLWYLIIAGGQYLPKPGRLGELYRGQESKLRRLTLYPYYYAHTRNQTHPISVPALDEALTIKVMRFGWLLGLVKFIFGLASALGRFFPFASVDVPLAVKPRMEPWSDGSEYWPDWLLRKVWLPRLGWFQIQSGVRGPGFQKTPVRAVDHYKDGQLLAFLVEYGIAGSFLRVLEDGDRPEGDPHAGRVVFRLDFTFLEGYESKPDYEPYGGAADFVIDEGAKAMRLVRVRAPRSPFWLDVNPVDPRFRHAEDQVLASIYFYVVSGKHLVEIHMGLNLVEVALFNAFDSKGRWDHPVRMALYPHLFAHELAEELTTENLLEDRAVFPQIFATTNASLMRHLNDRFGDYQLGHDEDFEGREAILMAGRAPGQRLEDVLPHSSLVWEKLYADIWQRYATALVDAAYQTDAQVASDACVVDLFEQLECAFLKPLPARYDRLRTRDGLARFISDTMHHLIIRHEVYGTSGVRLALDPRINKVQVPKDGGTYGVDEWRSLACIAMATSRVRYTPLLADFSDLFLDLKDERVRDAFLKAYRRFQDDLLALEVTLQGANKPYNYDILRPLPSDLDIGAGY